MIDEHITVETTAGASVDVSIGSAVQIIQGDPYTGEYTVTPSAQTQVLETAGLVAQQNITIEPIPSDWGHITWNGSVLTIS